MSEFDVVGAGLILLHPCPECKPVKKSLRGAWAVQSVEHPTLAHDLTVREFEPASGSVLTARLRSPIRLSLPLPHLRSIKNK